MLSKSSTKTVKPNDQYLKSNFDENYLAHNLNHNWEKLSMTVNFWGSHLVVLQAKQNTTELNLLCKVSTIISVDNTANPERITLAYFITTLMTLTLDVNSKNLYSTRYLPYFAM